MAIKTPSIPSIQSVQSIPAIKRARGYRLYDYAGNRYLDLFQANGRTLLGHRPFKLTSMLKNVISKGVISDLPSVYSARLDKALLRFFPGFKSFKIVSCMERALKLASVFLGREVAEEDVYDPVVQSLSKNIGCKVSVWRPMMQDEGDISPDVIIPIIPFLAGGAPVCIGFRDMVAEGFPDSDFISPVLLAGTLRCLFDLSKYEFPCWFRNNLLKNCSGWIQRGIYITPDFDRKVYHEVFKVFLKNGLLLSPFFPGPSILPAEASPGEVKKMIRLFRQNPGE